MKKETINKIRKFTQVIVFISLIVIGISFYYLTFETETIMAPMPAPSIEPPKSVPYTFIIDDLPNEGFIAVLLALGYYIIKKTIDLIFILLEKKLCKSENL